MSVAKAFTLIEMLVVVAILSILAALLMPALNKAMDMTNQVACLNNTKQLGMATQYYLNDYRNFFPTANYDNSSNSSNASAVFSRRFAEDNYVDSIYPAPQGGWRYIPIMRCPSCTLSDANRKNERINYAGNGGKRRWEGMVDGKFSGLMGQNGKGAGVKLHEVPKPAETILIVCRYASHYEADRGALFTYYSQTWIPQLQANHLNRDNIVFVDGHAKSMDYVPEGMATRNPDD